MNLRTGVSQWEPPASDQSSHDPASSSQEIVLHRPAPTHDAPDPVSTTSAEDSNQRSFSFDDVPPKIVVEPARAGDDRPTDAPNFVSGTTRPPIEYSRMDSGRTNLDGTDVPSDEKTKSSFFSRWRRRSGDSRRE